MNTCPRCGAEMTLNAHSETSCPFCGYVAEEVSVAAQRKPEPVQNSDADGLKTKQKEDALLSQAEFLDGEGQYKLALMYKNGVGVPRSAENAVVLFYKSALNGNRDAMYAYGECLLEGDGVPKDVKKALYWFIQAAQLGHSAARNSLREFSDGELDVVPERRISAGSPSLEEVLERVRPYCVEITCFNDGKPVSQGSGCVIADGLILTNAHVVSVISDKKLNVFSDISINFDAKYDRRRYRAEVAALEPDEDVALCVFKGESPVIGGEPPSMVSAHGVGVGREVFTVGNGLGRGLGVSKGVISRDLETDAYGHSEVLRTDMSVNPGNSGGALFDFNGNILGMMTFVATQRDNSLAYGMSYAVTSDTVMKIIAHLAQS